MRADRKQLARLIAALDKGDVLVVTRLDGLARLTRDLLNLLGAVIQRTEHQDTQAIHAKLDELLKAEGKADNDNSCRNIRRDRG